MACAAIGLFTPEWAGAAPLVPSAVRLQGVESADVQGDNGQDRYVGTGGLLLPRSVGHGTRTQVAGCPDCRWRLASPCALDLPGVAFPGQSVCLRVVRGCPGMAELLRVWFDAGAGWADLGLVCLRPGGPVTIRHLSSLVHDSFVKDLPALRLRTAPETGILAQLPVVFDTGQPAEGFAASYRLLDEDVAITGRTHWTWLFGDGGTTATDDPGGTYPHMTVSHAYRRAGSIPVRVEADWSASFTVDGLGPFPVREPVTQEAERWILVGEGRAVLAVR
jgi:hypothetical protein